MTIDINEIEVATFIQSVDWHDDVSSTNDLALELETDEAKLLPRLIGATRQHAGRGRGDNRWWSGEGILMFSVLLDMEQLRVPQCDWPRFSLVTGLSVAETMEIFLPNSSIGLKWPNDVWIGNRKVCGILIEQTDRGDRRLVVGVGWNVNSTFDGAPPEILSVATSMRNESSNVFSMTDILRCFLQRWEGNISGLAAGKIDVAESWKRFCVLQGRRIQITSGDSTSIAECVGVAPDGALLVDSDGKMSRICAGTVRIVD
ncbi:MAG: biotin--[acetyl-CoA-carboxylase] ligase [Planctomycetes bacterium]|nr:biotin--[acetyl-CoA-carboxylase] ligase [Planctomycetota bacterium]